MLLSEKNYNSLNSLLFSQIKYLLKFDFKVMNFSLKYNIYIIIQI